MEKNKIAIVILYLLGIAVIVHSADSLIFHGGSVWNIVLIAIGFGMSISARSMFEDGE